MKSLKCASFDGNLQVVNIESKFLNALPSFNIIGLANTTIKESENRVKSALLTLNFKFPPQKIIINLSPSDIPKRGSHFDLAIAILIALQKESFDESFFVFGELGLDGSVKSTNSLFSVLLFLSKQVISAKVIVPKSIALRAATIPNFRVFAVENLEDTIKFFMDEEFAKSCEVVGTHPLFANTLEILGKNYVPNLEFKFDFSDIKGQVRAKRASLIAAAGFHNVLYEGSPGCGKSMCAKRLRYILPPQSIDEVMLSAAYESLDNKDADFSALRPFRSPHHTSTRGSIFGGGSNLARVGEVALANGGELFFDELPHFGKQILESLREPLEDNRILISRVNSKTKYQTKFLFAAAMNPCPCGNLFSKTQSCVCSEMEIKRYKSTISVPLLDRIDLYVAMDEVSKDDKSSVTSQELYEKVLYAFKAQKIRGQTELNAKLNDQDVGKFCLLDSDAKSVLDMAISKFSLSQRGINKSLKVARTIADLAGKEVIGKSEILESLSFRVRSLG